MIKRPALCGARPLLTPDQIIQRKRIRLQRWKWSQQHDRPTRYAPTPSNAELAQQFGVSREAIKRAMSDRYFAWAIK